jgi:hypothetical protein
VTVASVCGFVLVWSWLFARPSLVARVALQAGLAAPPTRAAWLRATVLSLALMIMVVAVALTVAVSAGMRLASALGPGISVMFVTAVILDILDDARARRAPLAPVWVVHQVQYLGVIDRVLGDAGIPCHVHASNYRTLLAFFGPWAPAIVLVPEAQAVQARAMLDDALRPATASIPRALVR